MHIIEKKQSIKKVALQFQTIVEDNASDYEELSWVFPNGKKAYIKTYKLKTEYGNLSIGIPDDLWGNRMPHLFSLSSVVPMTPEVEINIPLGLDRKVSGVFAKKGNTVLLCSRGHINAYRGRIKKETVFNYFKEWLIEVKDGEQTSTLIQVADLSSNNYASEIAKFVLTINKFKHFYKNKTMENT